MATVPDLPTLLDRRYRLGAPIGRGGMSDVYRGEDVRSGTPVAVKVVRTGDPEMARRLTLEAVALERFDHPGLVSLLDAGIHDGQPYLVMELVNGPTLAGMLAGGPIEPTTVAAFGATLAGALAYVHERGVVHRDVKPANILITEDGRAKLSDFGIARLVDVSSMTATGTTLGTASYMAPEQLENHEVGSPADLWSLGIVLLECLTGQRVYEGTPSEVVARRLSGPVPIPTDLPRPWRLLLTGMLDHRPDERLSAAEAASLLQSPVLGSPWQQAAEPGDAGGTTQRYDLTALAGDPTALAAGDPTAIAAGDPTAILSPDDRTRKRAYVLGLAGIVVVALAAILLATSGGGASKPSTSGKAAPAVRTAQRPGTTTSTSTTTTTTTVPITAPIALADLVRDVASGESAGTITSGAGQSIVNPAEQAVADEDAGHAGKAATDLQNAASALASATQAGSVESAESATLSHDLSVLGAALGLTAAAVPTTTTQPPTPGLPASSGNGKGPGSGKGPGHSHGTP